VHYANCNSPDDIASPAPGPHTFSVVATNHGATDGTPATASWSSVQAQADLCGTIASDTTIGPDYAAVYLLSCNVDVSHNVTLTAQPGTIIKAASGTQMSVDGSLDAVGSAEDPIVFTSINDNSVGGSTGSGSPVAGNWTGIMVSGAGSIDLEHASVSYVEAGVSSGPDGGEPGRL